MQSLSAATSAGRMEQQEPRNFKRGTVGNKMNPSKAVEESRRTWEQTFNAVVDLVNRVKINGICRVCLEKTNRIWPWSRYSGTVKRMRTVKKIHLCVLDTFPVCYGRLYCRIWHKAVEPKDMLLLMRLQFFGRHCELMFPYVPSSKWPALLGPTIWVSRLKLSGLAPGPMR